MAGLVPAIHALAAIKDVDARDKPGHNEHSAFLSTSGNAVTDRRGRRYAPVSSLTKKSLYLRAADLGAGRDRRAHPRNTAEFARIDPGVVAKETREVSLRAKAEPTRTGKRYRVEFLDPPNVIEEKVHTAFQEIEDEKNRLEEFQKFYARQVLYTYDGEYAPAAKTLGIKAPELKSMLK